MKHQLDVASKELDQIKEENLKTIEYRDVIQSELDLLKAEAAQRDERDQ